MGGGEVGRGVRRARDLVGLSQRELADHAGVARSWLSEVEVGRGEPTIAYTKAIYRALREYLPSLGWSWLITGEGSPPSGVGAGLGTRYDGRQGGDPTDRREAMKAGFVLGAAALGDRFLAA